MATTMASHNLGTARCRGITTAEPRRNRPEACDGHLSENLRLGVQRFRDSGRDFRLTEARKVSSRSRRIERLREVSCRRHAVTRAGQLETFEGDAKTRGKQSPAGGREPPDGRVVSLDFHCSTK